MTQDNNSAMFCSACGQKNECGAKFCTKCGKQISTTVTSQPPLPTTDPTYPTSEGSVQKESADTAMPTRGGMSMSKAIGAVVIGGLVIVVAVFVFIDLHMRSSWDSMWKKAEINHQQIWGQKSPEMQTINPLQPQQQPIQPQPNNTSLSDRGAVDGKTLLGAKPAVTAGPAYDLRNVVGYYESGSASPRILVIKGQVANLSTKEKSGIRVFATIQDKAEKILAEQAVYAGNVVPGERLRKIDQEGAAKILNNRSGEGLANMNVAPGKAIPFMVVFFDAPANMDNYKLEAKDGE